MIAAHENKDLAERFLSEAIAKYGIEPGQLTIHSDRGSPMVAQNVAQMMAGLGVTKSHSRPKTSNDNPYSESQYKTLKYRHDFPDRFGSLEDARAWCIRFFTWYNQEHRHSGIGLHTPYDVHFGLAGQLREMRADVLEAVYAKHPERFVRKRPEPGRCREADHGGIDRSACLSFDSHPTRCVGRPRRLPPARALLRAPGHRHRRLLRPRRHHHHRPEPDPPCLEHPPLGYTPAASAMLPLV